MRKPKDKRLELALIVAELAYRRAKVGDSLEAVLARVRTLFATPPESE